MAGTAVADLHKVSVLGKSTTQLWTAVEDVEWLINYVATEVALGGVFEVEVAAVAEGNCEVEGLRVKWNFGAQSWRAEFVTGNLQGTIVRSSVSKMNAENGRPCLPRLRWNLRRRVSNSCKRERYCCFADAL